MFTGGGIFHQPVSYALCIFARLAVIVQADEGKRVETNSS